MNGLNQKPPSAKFDSKFDFMRIEFPDTLLYIDQQNILQTTISENQVTVKTSIIRNRNVRTLNSTTNMFNISIPPVFLENLLKTLMMNERKKMSYSKFRKMINSIKNNSSTNKNVMISNVYHYE